MARVRGPYAGRAFIADTSAWARSNHPRVRPRFAEAAANGQIVTCPLVNLELLHSTRDGDQYDETSERLSRLRDVPVTRSVTNAALMAQRALAHVRPLHHRSVNIADLLIAACAADAAIGVLHYDEDFDRLADVLAFESRWIAPRGSL